MLAFLRHGFAACFSLLAVFMAMPAQAQNSTLCMSDEEFRAYLHEALMFQLGYGGAVCCARDNSRPNSCKEVKRQAMRIEEVGADYLRYNHQTALRPFQRAYSEEAETAFRRRSEVLEGRAKKFVDGFGEHECAAWLSGIEALSYLRESDLGAFITTQLTPAAEFSEERKKIPACD